MRKINTATINRVFDANINRAKEGMRVCEDICRFLFNKKSFTRRYKDIRHALSSILSESKTSKKEMIRSRNTRKDIGAGSIELEFKRNTVYDIFYANSQRIKESLRVLEEFMKLADSGAARKLKKLRYKIYALEQDVVKEF